MPPAYRGRHFEAFGRYLQTGRRTIPWQGAELRALHANGREFPIEVSIGEYGDGPDRRFTGIIRDISRRKDIEAQLLQAQKMDAIGRLAGGVAHDFNNLLTAIGGYAELVGVSLDPSDDRRQEAINGIRQATDQAAALTRQLLAFSRTQALRPAVIDLSQVVTNLSPMLRRLLGERIELDRQADRAAVPHARRSKPDRGDPGQPRGQRQGRDARRRDAHASRRRTWSSTRTTGSITPR